MTKSIAAEATPSPLSWIRRECGWLTEFLEGILAAPSSPALAQIEQRAAETQALGPRPLWEGYTGARYAGRTTRSPNEVRTPPRMGAVYTAMVMARKPASVIEFGTAFGVSGMYWLAGLEASDAGHLFTFEPNDDWATVAEGNLRAISDRFTLTRGTFEENAAAVLTPRATDIAFIDAIHTSAFVFSQFEILKPYLTERAIVLFDDIGFSPDMVRCWNTIAGSDFVLASAAIGRRVGIVELR